MAYAEIYGGFIVERYFLQAWYEEVKDQKGNFNGAPEEFLDFWEDYIKDLLDYIDLALQKDGATLQTEYQENEAALQHIVDDYPNWKGTENAFILSLKEQLDLELRAAQYIKAQLP